MVDVLARPERLEDAVREAERQHVLHGLLAEVVVDPEDLVLAEVAEELLVQPPRRGEVEPERLLDDHARPALGPAALADLPHERRDRVRRHGEVVEAVAIGAVLAVDLRELLGGMLLGALVGELHRDVVRRPRKLVPDLRLELDARVLAHRRLHRLLETLRTTSRLRAVPTTAKRSGSIFRERERIERREELALREVARRAEDHEHARIGRPAALEPLEQRVFSDFGQGPSTRFLRPRGTACPPNWLRSAAATFAPKLTRRRDAKRAKSELAITGTGT